MTGDLLIISNVLLWCIVILLFIAVFFLYRHVGDALNRRTKDSPENTGPKIGSRIQSRLTMVNGGFHEIGSGHEGLPSVILFAGHYCRFCQDARPGVSTLAKQYRQDVRLVVVFNGKSEHAQSYVRDMDDAVVLVCDEKKELSELWSIKGVPFAVVTDINGIVLAKGLASAIDKLNSYFEIAFNAQRPKNNTA